MKYFDLEGEEKRLIDTILLKVLELTNIYYRGCDVSEIVISDGLSRLRMKVSMQRKNNVWHVRFC